MSGESKLDGALPSARQVVTAVVMSGSLTALWVAIVPLIPGCFWCSSAFGGLRGDAIHYMDMAGHPGGVERAPYAYRVLEPWLAQTLGGPHHFPAVYRGLTYLALAAAGPAVYLIGRRLGGSHPAALVGAAGLLCLPGWLFNVYQPYDIDAPALSLMAWSMTAVAYGWLAVVPMLLTALGQARETVSWFALPIYMWLRSKWVDLRAAVQVAVLMGPAVITMWALRIPLKASGPASRGIVAAIRLGLRDVLFNRILHGFGWWSMYSLAGSLGIWWVLSLAGWRHGRRLWWLLVPVFAQFAFGGDWSRFALYAFPVVVPAGAIALWIHPRRWLLLALVAVQSTAVFADLAVNGGLSLNVQEPSMWISAGLAVATALVLWTPSRQNRTQPLASHRPRSPEGSPAAAPQRSYGADQPVPTLAGRGQGQDRPQ